MSTIYQQQPSANQLKQEKSFSQPPSACHLVTLQHLASPFQPILPTRPTVCLPFVISSLLKSNNTSKFSSLIQYIADYSFEDKAGWQRLFLLFLTFFFLKECVPSSVTDYQIFCLYGFKNNLPSQIQNGILIFVLQQLPFLQSRVLHTHSFPLKLLSCAMVRFHSHILNRIAQDGNYAGKFKSKMHDIIDRFTDMTHYRYKKCIYTVYIYNIALIIFFYYYSRLVYFISSTPSYTFLDEWLQLMWICF